jgi:DNA topoisomerase IA
MNLMIGMIVEGPNKTTEIRSALGAGWEVVASVGHGERIKLLLDPLRKRRHVELQLPPRRNSC